MHTHIQSITFPSLNLEVHKTSEIASKIQKDWQAIHKSINDGYLWMVGLEGILSIFNEFKVYYFYNWKKCSKCCF